MCLHCVYMCPLSSEWTDEGRLWGTVLCLREWSQTQAVGERLPPIDVTSLTVRGCYGSLRMEWLRTNGVCFPDAGMVKRALIECTEKRGFPSTMGGLCTFVKGRADVQSDMRTWRTDSSSPAPLRQPPPPPPSAPERCSRSVLSIWAISSPPVGLALRQDAFAESRSRARESRGGDWCVRVRAGAVLGCCKCAGLRWTPHCNKSKVTAGTGWNATTTPDPPPHHHPHPPPPIRVEPCIRGHYITRLFLFWLLSHAGIARSGLSGRKHFPPIFLVSPVGVSVPPPPHPPTSCWLSPFLSLQFIWVIGAGHRECIGKSRADEKKVIFIWLFRKNTA